MGLVQREIEAAGIATITLSWIPEVTASVSVPRLAAIQYPEGRLLGQPGDAAGQMAVLRATLQALVNIQNPGEMVCLPFEWQVEESHTHPPETPPIVKLIQRQPWLLPRLLRRDPPA